MDKNIQHFYEILLISISSAFFLTFGSSGLAFGKKIARASWLGPLVTYVFLVVYSSATSRPDPPSTSPVADFLFFLALLPLFGLPAFIFSLFSTWQIIILLERYIFRRNLSLNWWIFFIIISLLNAGVSYIGIANGFELGARGG